MVDTDDGRWTTPRVWHKLPTGELKMDKTNNGHFTFEFGNTLDFE